MTSRSDLEAGIEPGSMPYGARQELVGGLEAAVGGEQGGPGTPTAAVNAGVDPVDSVDDPLGALLSGEIDPGMTEDPITSGLSVGPGVGPMGQVSNVSPKQSRLIQVATQAKSPMIRWLARNELKRLVAEEA